MRLMRKKIAALLLVMPFLSCKTINHYPHLYDKSGFESGGRPSEESSGNTAKAPPQNYLPPQYQQQVPPQPMPPQPMPLQQVSPQPMPPQPMPQYQAAPMQPQAVPLYAQPAPYSPYSQTPYASSYQVPGSRFYSNPYAIPPSPYYLNYDADQHYVPPVSHNAIEQLQQNRVGN